METSEQPLLIEERGAADWVTLNRPASYNALNGPLVQALWDYFTRLGQDYSRRVVVLRGAGRGFCAGLDLAGPTDPFAKKMPDGRDPKGPSASIIGLLHAMRNCPQPIVGLTHGAATGGGLAVALATDIRISGSSAKYSDGFIKVGIAGNELGLGYWLPRMVGLSVTSEMMMTGRAIGAERSVAVGLASETVPDADLETAGEAMAADLLRASPFGLRKTKETLNRTMRLNDLEAVIDYEMYHQSLAHRGPEFAEATKAFFEKREPDYDAAMERYMKERA